MERPEVIEKQIDELKKSLHESKLHYQYEFVCNDDFSSDMIGFFNLSNARKILTLLHEGKHLQFRHGVFGKVDIYMNPQRNRIFVSDNKDINENNIMKFIVWGVGDWFSKLEN